jgi:hypothetical protein
MSKDDFSKDSSDGSELCTSVASARRAEPYFMRTSLRLNHKAVTEKHVLTWRGVDEQVDTRLPLSCMLQAAKGPRGYRVVIRFSTSEVRMKTMEVEKCCSVVLRFQIYTYQEVVCYALM